MITLDKDWQIYANQVRDRCRDLISQGIWGGIDIIQLETWRRNFNTDEEKYFAACILDATIYRSNEQTFALIEQLLGKNLNNLFRLLRAPHLQNFPFNLRDPYTDPKVRLVSAVRSTDPVTKSSNEILRFMKRYFLVSERWIVNPWNIPDLIDDDVHAFIFIDDFLGTGQQFHDIIMLEKLSPLLSKVAFIYAPLVAHEHGISFLKKTFPRLHVTYTEKLTKQHHSFFKNYFPKEEEAAKRFYLEMLGKRNIILIPTQSYGYGNLEITFAFEHAAPDNSLHILHKRHPELNPLFNH